MNKNLREAKQATQGNWARKLDSLACWVIVEKCLPFRGPKFLH